MPDSRRWPSVLILCGLGLLSLAVLAWSPNLAAVAFVLTSAGLLALSQIREPETPTVRTPETLSNRLRALPSLLRSDLAFTRYFLARALATMAGGMPTRAAMSRA